MGSNSKIDLRSKLLDAPYLSGQRRAPKTMTSESLCSIFTSFTVIEMIAVLLSIAGGVLYLCFSQLFDLLGFICLIGCPGRQINHWTKSKEKSFGTIQQGVCPKTGRMYITRWSDPKRDCVDGSRLILSGFHKDPIAMWAQPDIGPRHLFGQNWFRFFLESSNYDVLVQEWAEEEKLVGILVFTQRSHNLFRDLLDYSKWMANLIRYLGIDPRTSYRQLRLAFAGESKFRSTCRQLGLKNIIHCKYIAVEKGFQGQGIGSNLSRLLVQHAQSLKSVAYLESSNVANIPLYERFGFRLFEEWKLAPDAPPMYIMIRPVDENKTIDASLPQIEAKNASSIRQRRT